MHRHSTAWVAMLLLLIAAKADAGIRPSFQLDPSAWHATDIVLASEGEVIDGIFTVLEVWAGDLEVGDTVKLPSLAMYETDTSRTVKPGWGIETKEGDPPFVLSAQRVVLFLKRDTAQADGDAAGQDAGEPQRPFNWAPATFWKQMSVSIAWLQGDKVFALTQMINPGPSILTDQGVSPKQFKERVFAVADARKKLNAIDAMNDPKQRVQAALKHIDSELYLASGKAFELLGEAGPAAVPPLRAILNDPDKRRLHTASIKALVEAGGQAVADDLIAIVDAELAFWQETAPRLETGWWNGKGLKWEEVGPLRDRYSHVLTVLYALQKLKPAHCRPSVEAFRDYWRSMPQLEDKAGLTQMSEACDKVLKDLPKWIRNPI